MPDLGTRLQRELEGMELRPFTVDDFHGRRDRKRRNQRIAAGIVGVAVFVAAVWIVTSGLSLDRSTPAAPGSKTGSTQTAPPAALDTAAPDVAAAQPAGAIDDGFQGPYRVIALDDSCGFHSSRYRVHIRYVSEKVRTYDRFAQGSGWPLRYVRAERFPWQRQGGSPLELRYDPRTDTAVGIQQGPQCPRWRVRLVPIG